MNNIITEVLQEILNYNIKLIPAVEDTVENLRGQREDKSLKTMVYIVDGLKWEFEALFRIKVLKVDINIVEEDNVNSVLEQMAEAFENQDFVLLSDLLEYEILPILRDVQDKLVRTGACL